MRALAIDSDSYFILAHSDTQWAVPQAEIATVLRQRPGGTPYQPASAAQYLRGLMHLLLRKMRPHRPAAGIAPQPIDQ